MFCIFWSIHFTVQLSLAALVPFPFDPCLSITVASCDTSIWKNLKCFYFVLCSFVLFCSLWLYESAYASIVTGVLFLHIPTSIYYLICFGPGSFFLGWRTSSSWCDLHFLYDYQCWRTEHLFAHLLTIRDRQAFTAMSKVSLWNTYFQIVLFPFFQKILLFHWAPTSHKSETFLKK